MTTINFGGEGEFSQDKITSMIESYKVAANKTDPYRPGSVACAIACKLEKLAYAAKEQGYPEFQGLIMEAIK